MDDYEEDIEEDEEQFCSVEELDRLTGDMLNSIQPSGYEDDEAVEPLDSADDVIDELEALMEVCYFTIYTCHSYYFQQSI